MRFIECHDAKTNNLLLIPISQIISIRELSNAKCVFIETFFDKKSDSYGFYIKESYAEIKTKLNI